MKEVELPYVVIRYEEPIVCFYYKEGAELGFPEIKDLVRYSELLSGGKPYFTFSDLRVQMNITEQGKKYVADSRNMKLFRGTAALVKNNMYRFAVNFLCHFKDNSYPFRAFTNQDSAMKWLRSLPLDQVTEHLS